MAGFATVVSVKICAERKFLTLVVSCQKTNLFAFCRDGNCLTDERCIQGVCKAICNSDAACNRNQICENRLCEIGCRSDDVCEQHQACINNKCQSKCPLIVALCDFAFI